MNNPSSVKAFPTTFGPKIFDTIETGRMIETFGNLRSRTRLGHDQVGLEVLPAGRYIERETAKCHIIRRRKRIARQVWKCWVSVGPMLSRIRNTTGSVTFRASVG
jgi:hypothetical protein